MKKNKDVSISLPGKMKRFFIYLSYNGKNYCGWQIQPNGISVQETLEKALSTLLRKEISVTGAGRTDAGVHASLMPAHFDWDESDLDPVQLVEKLNRILPADIAVSQIVPVLENAHARFDAISRTYKYYLSSRKDPFRHEYTHRIHGKIDVDEMNHAAARLFDYTDFTSFSKLHTDVKTNNCQMMYAQWEYVNNEYIFTIQADRFLRNMVRAIVGTLLDVGRGKISADDFCRIIEAKDRSKAGTSVPGNALFLVSVNYPENIFILP